MWEALQSARDIIRTKPLVRQGGEPHQAWGRGGMADTGDLKSFDFGHEGSNPSAPTILL